MNKRAKADRSRQADRSCGIATCRNSLVKFGCGNAYSLLKDRSRIARPPQSCSPMLIAPAAGSLTQFTLFACEQWECCASIKALPAGAGLDSENGFEIFYEMHALFLKLVVSKDQVLT